MADMSAMQSCVKGWITVAMLAALVAAVPATAFASEWDEVTFEGSGWGHGVGMSQYGAYGMAKVGYDYSEILAHYYQGTEISTLDPLTSLWVNLERNFSTLTLTVDELSAGQVGADVSVNWSGGTTTASVGATIDLALVGQDGCSASVQNPGEPAVDVVLPTGCSIDFSWYQWDNPAISPTTKIYIEGCSLPDWNVAPTTWVPCQYARGQLHLRSGPGGLDLSVEMLMDDYILGISEMPYYWTEQDALMAQAVAARSYAESRRILRGNLANNSCDGWCHVKDTPQDQRYVGWGHGNNGSWVAASSSTYGEVLTHHGSSIGVIAAFYSSSSGGNTEFGHEMGFASNPVEWLSSVSDSWAVDGTVWNPNASWTVTVGVDSVAAAVGLDSLTYVGVTETRPGSGSAKWIEFQGLDGGVFTTVTKSGSWVDNTFGLKSQYFTVDFKNASDEMFFYDASDGDFGYYRTQPDGNLGPEILGGSGYSLGWDSISAVDLDGDGQDEIFFYRSADGVFRYYDINVDATLGAPILTGSGYSLGWDSISAVDLDGDGQDEMFFYRSSDGAYRYYNIGSNGAIGAPIKAGTGYSLGWDSISAVDLDGDGQDEMFFYRSADGAFRYYDIAANGSLGQLIAGGTGYSFGWSSITAVDLDGDGQDEMFFYRDDGTFRYYDISPDATLGAALSTGNDYSTEWSTIVSLDIDGLE